VERTGAKPDRASAATADVAVRRLLELVRGTRITDIEVEWDGGSVRVSREPAVEADQARPAVVHASSDGPVVVTSPFVGVFHRQPPPSFPNVGEPVSAGQAIAHVETLGIQNSVVAPCDGLVAEILVKDGTPVEYGQPLAVMRRSAGEATGG